jgi:hypothetical protein
MRGGESGRPKEIHTFPKIICDFLSLELGRDLDAPDDSRILTRIDPNDPGLGVERFTGRL